MAAAGETQMATMTNEIKLAAERLRKARKDSAAFDGGYPATVQGRQRSLLDHVALAEAYLAEHRADDDEPTGYEWLQDCGLSGGTAKLESGELTIVPASKWAYIEIEENSQWHRCQHIITLPFPETRGDVRRLCSALGITLKDAP